MHTNYNDITNHFIFRLLGRGVFVTISFPALFSCLVLTLPFHRPNTKGVYYHAGLCVLIKLGHSWIFVSASPLALTPKELF